MPPDTRDLGILMVSLMCGVPFILGLIIGWKAAKFTWPVFHWPWREW